MLTERDKLKLLYLVLPKLSIKKQREVMTLLKIRRENFTQTQRHVLINLGDVSNITISSIFRLVFDGHFDC